MAVKSSGQLSMTNIKNEFNYTAGQNFPSPNSMSQYRRLVASSGSSEYIFPSGQIKFSDFYSKSKGFQVDVLLVGGGGGGGGADNSSTGAGGGGGGGVRLLNNVYVNTGSSSAIRVGGGGLGGAFNPGQRGQYGRLTRITLNGINYGVSGGAGGGGTSATAGGSQTSGNAGGGAYPIGVPGPGGVNFNGLYGNNGGNAGGSRQAGGGGGVNSRGNNGGSATRGEGGQGFDLVNWMGTVSYFRGISAYLDRFRTGIDGAYGEIAAPTGFDDGGGVGGGGGGGDGADPTGNESYVLANDGGGFGCFPAIAPNAGDQLRDGLNGTGGGGGGAARSNGAGRGGSGVVVVRYKGNNRRDTSSGSNVLLRTGNPITGDTGFHHFVVFGKLTDGAQTSDINLTFTTNANAIFN